MKRSLIFFTSIGLAFSSCREKAPLINYGNWIKTKDTTYEKAVETAQPRNVLIEEFTGASCAPCVLAHGMIKDLIAARPGRIVVTGNHIIGYAQADPILHKSKYDLRTQDATDIGNAFGGITFIPGALIDRVKNTSGYLLGKGEWPGVVDTRITIATPVNISLEKSVDASARTVDVKVRIAYTKEVPEKHSLTVSLIENGIIDAQKSVLESDGIADDYTHNEVLRDVITNATGEAILDSIAVKKPGRVFERSFTVTLKPEWVISNLHLVAYVSYNEADNKEVMQAVEVKVD